MQLAALNDGSGDGQLMIVSPDARHCADAPAQTLQAGLVDWTASELLARVVSACPTALDPGVRTEAHLADGHTPFEAIDQQVVPCR